MNTELLQALCNTTGISGYEQEATDCFLDALRPCAAECSTDLMGNAMVVLDPPTPHRPRIMLEAHADEIFEEAENRLHAQKAVLVKLLGK